MASPACKVPTCSSTQSAPKCFFFCAQLFTHTLVQGRHFRVWRFHASLRSGVTPENHNASVSCGQSVAACGPCSLKQQEKAGPFSLGSPPLRTTTAGQFDEALDDMYICMDYLWHFVISSLLLYFFFSSFCAGGTAVHIPLPLLWWTRCCHLHSHTCIDHISDLRRRPALPPGPQLPKLVYVYVVFLWLVWFLSFYFFLMHECMRTLRSTSLINCVLSSQLYPYNPEL